ncbi:carboxypeptidase regulatory-like domain-containing protein [Thomasclavelia cocleata]|uniref:carboxypeptidase regulatory-like domain-containing protein n=1 Tax=Thomasclavelia cocleata TaxID=69824 RepID=UPI0025705D91|nr:carboxypeptidase regulatory-like domain-containing protein [Thomasclavelia cocleata]
MKKILGKVFSIFTVFLMVISITTVNVFAETSSQDGLEVITITDKESYKDEDKATVILSIKNTNGYDMKDVEVNVSLPKQLSSSEKTTFNIPLLKANEIKEYKVIVERSDEKVTIKPSEDNPSDINSSVNTGDISPITGLIGIAGLSLFSILFLKNKNKLKKVMVLAIISSMVVSSFSVSSVNAQTSHPNTKEIKLTQNVKFGNNTYPLDILVRYATENGEVVDEGEVTREQWITKLVDNLQLTSEFEHYSFDDFDKANDASKIETAIQHGIIDLKAGEDNMILFSPNDYATREFVAYTTAKALGFVDNGNKLECKDKDILNYPYEDYLSVHNGMFKLIDDYFKPTQYVSLKEIEVVIAKIKEITNSTSIGTGENNKIEYQNNVKEFTTSYELDKENNRIITSDSDLAMLKVGDIALLNNSANINDSTAIKVESISNQNAQYMITYTAPSLDEVISDMQVEGKADNQNATFIPAENVTVDGDIPISRGSIEGEIPFNGKMSLNTEIKLSDNRSVKVKAEINLKEIQYKFDINASWNRGIQFNQVYLAVLLENTLSFSYNRKYNDYKESIKKLGEINCPMGYGFSSSAELFLVMGIEGKAKLVLGTDVKSGFQYKNGNFRTIASVDNQIHSIELEAKEKIGIKPQFGVKWHKIDAARFSGEGGLCVDGKLSNISANPFQFCFDANMYAYSSLEAKVGPDFFNLTFSKDIYTSSNSPYKRKAHFEEIGKVDKCTRGRNTYHGVVKRAVEPNNIIEGAKIEVYKGNMIMDSTYSNANGEFRGNKLNSGEYTLRVSAIGYIPYEQEFNITGDQPTYLQPRLIMKGEEGIEIKNDLSLKIGQTYRIECISDKNLNSYNKTDTVTEYFYKSGDKSDVVLDEKKLSGVKSYRPMDKGDFIDIKLNSGELNVFVIKDGAGIWDGERDDFYKYFKITELDHDPFKKFYLNEGDIISLDYQYIGTQSTGVGYSFKGSNLSGTRRITDYYWNKRFGLDITVTEYPLRKKEQFWTGVDEGHIHTYVIDSGSAVLYMSYESAEKLVIK